MNEQEQGFLKAQKKAQELAEMYKNDPKQKSFNLLLLGETGSSKTPLLKTARKPVHIDSFDPGGTKGLRDEIAQGDIIVDSSFESESRTSPTQFLRWCEEMKDRERNDYFSHLGTYCIDSATSWSATIMNNILKKAGLAGKNPRFTKDYGPQKAEILNWVSACLDLPCDFVLTGHLEQFVDADGQKLKYQFLTTGKATMIIPSLFDEIWVSLPKESSKGIEFSLLTKSNGTYIARSRLSKAGLLDIHEKPNIKDILKKAGMDQSDKPRLIGG
jgi:hypothetical protein